MDLLLTAELRPFVVMAGFIVVLLVLELALMLIGLSSAVEWDGADVDVAPAGIGLNVAEFSEIDLSAQELAMLDQPLVVQQNEIVLVNKPTTWRRIAAILGLGQGPILIWITAMAAGVSSLGLLIQIALDIGLGKMLPAQLALILVLLPGLVLGRMLAVWIARMVPSFESHAISGQSFHGRRGTIVIGTARRGDAAQVRWQDMYGTTHSLMAEPLRDTDVIGAGAQVLIVKTRDRQARLLALS